MALSRAYHGLVKGLLPGEAPNIKIGTFLPLLMDNSLNPNEGQTYAIQIGRYTRIGDLVVYDVHIRMISLGSFGGTNGINVGGFPFTMKPGIITTAIIGRAFSLNMNPIGEPLTIRFDPATQSCRMMQLSLINGHVSFQVQRFTDGGIKFSGTYVTDEPNLPEI